MGNNKSSRQKPLKPYPTFPLFAHLSGQWAKKIRSKLYYFGPWAYPEDAHRKYLDQVDDLRAGRKPRAKDVDGVRIGQLVNAFLNSKLVLVQSGELTRRTFEDYKETGERFYAVLSAGRTVSDLQPADFEQLRQAFPSTWGILRVSNEIQRVRSICRYAYDQGMIDAPLRFGQTFRKPSQKALRRLRRSKPRRMFSASEILQLLQHASVTMRAMILLGINCGYGNNDVATLTLSSLDLDRGWVGHSRPKTGIERRCALWPETIRAVREVIAHRPKSKSPEYGDLLFLTRTGDRWYKPTVDNPVAKAFAKVLRRAKVERPGIGFYGLRHGFETIGGAAKDQVAVDFIMGHAPPSNDMSDRYREDIEDFRLKDVTDHVHRWLFGVVVLPEPSPAQIPTRSSLAVPASN